MPNMNIEEFLLPIVNTDSSDGNNCGKYLKYDYIYDQIKEMRREDDPRLTQGVWLIEPKKAAWNDVRKACESALKSQTKDLQIAVWWLEAMIALKGFSGLNQGIELLYGLCDRYWENVWPIIEVKNGDASARMAPFYFFTEKVSDRILMIPLTFPSDITSNSFSLSDWITARHNLHIKNSSGYTIKDFQKSVTTTSLEFLQEIDDNIKNSEENLKKLEALLNDHCKNDVPSFRVLYEYFGEIKQINTKNLEDRKKIWNAENAKRQAKLLEDAQKAKIEKNLETEVLRDSLTEENNKKEEKPEDAKPTPTIENAYSALNEIATFLEEKQPQSPSSMLIKIASSIGKKTFKELMEINMKNGATLMGTISELYHIIKQDSKQTPFILPEDATKQTSPPPFNEDF
ncbi:MAG: type VI secretion system protein TssA [Alphaproteobacteria bacterium]|nr:type VI secretion system protein TssA [Alphaproteobacteria bacterium]